MRFSSDVAIIVCDDSNGKLAMPTRDNVYIFDYAAQEAYAGKHYEAMPHRSAASPETSGTTSPTGRASTSSSPLDYDCDTRPDWLGVAPVGHRQGGRQPRRYGRSLDDGWVNSIDTDGFYSRGYPYEYPRRAICSAVDRPSPPPAR
jgi:hypothetical protein